jgi:hypothetical protein
MTYKAFRRIRAVLSLSLLAYAGNTIYRLAAGSSFKSPWEVVFWSMGPPLWFFAEYLLLENGYISLPHGATKTDFLKGGKDYADYASKIWAGVLAAVLFLYSRY